MNATHFIINGDDVIGVIYNSEEFGRVVVFRSPKIDVERRIEIYKLDSAETEKVDLMKLVMDVLPK